MTLYIYFYNVASEASISSFQNKPIGVQNWTVNFGSSSQIHTDPSYTQLDYQGDSLVDLEINEDN